MIIMTEEKEDLFLKIEVLDSYLHLKVSTGLKERLTKCAEDNGVKRSQLVRAILEQWLTKLNY